MGKQTRASHPIYNLLPMEVEGFDFEIIATGIFSGPC